MTPTRKNILAKERYRLLLQAVTDSTAINPLETKAEQEARKQKSKTDYNYFVNTYFKRYATAPCAPFHIKLANDIRNNKRAKYILAWGRGLAKSTHVNLLIPLWLWINNDIKCMVLVGQNYDKATILLSDLQAEFEANQLLIHDYGQQKTIGSWEDGKFVTKNDCAFFALGIGQSVRGTRHRNNRPDYCTGDDLDTKEIVKNPKRVREYANWIIEDLLGALSPTASRYIHVNNIFAPNTILTHIRDTRKGFVYNQLNAEDKEGNPTWKENVILTEFYQSQKNSMGSLSFNAEYNNSPYTEGTVFTNDMILYKNIPPLNSFTTIIAWWDVAYSDSKTADYNAVKIWGLYQNKFYLIKCFVRQCKMQTVMHWVNEFDEQLPPGIFISWYFESQFWNDALMMVHEQVSQQYKMPVQFIKSERPTQNKFDRMLKMLPFYQQQKIIYNLQEKQNQDMQLGIAQLLGVEPGYKTKDDSPDADASAIELLAKYSRAYNAPYKSGSRENFKF